MTSLEKLNLSEIQQLNPRAINNFISQLAQNGFAIVKTDGFPERNAILRTLKDARKMETFRFPPHEHIGIYSEDQRESFRAFFKWTQICLTALLKGLDPLEQHSADLKTSLGRTVDPDNLFPPNGKGNEPFVQGMEFSGSFFNVFHYDFGLLNAHRDRCLITMVAVDQIQDNSTPKTALWAKGPAQNWINVDELVETGEIILFTGEDFEQRSTQFGTPLPAAMHCTRVDPNAERLILFDDLPDPDSSTSNNRVSVAFVLSDTMM